MTHKHSHTLLGFILLIALASPTVASAQPSASANTLTQDDIEFIFGPEANIAAFKQLSPQEMAETQGEFFGGSILRFLSFVKGITLRVGNYWPARVPGRDSTWQVGSNFRFKYMHHTAHHRFPLDSP